MAGVEAQADQARIGQAEKSGRFLWRFYPRADVVMKYSTQAGFAAHRLRDAVSTRRKDLPLSLAHTLFRSNTPGIVRAHGVAIGVVAQHDQALWPANLSKQAGSAHGVGLTGGMAFGIMQIDTDP